MSDQSSRPCRSSEIPDEDHHLMRALANGSDDALADLMNRWQMPVTSFLYRSIGDYDIALELSQEVFVRLYKNRKSYRAGGKFSTWLFTIASNLARNHFRWKSRHPEAHLENNWGSNTPGESLSHADPGKTMEKCEQAEAVREAVLRLPEKLRFPVILSYYHDLNHVEIAKILDCSTKAVETRLYRARKQLKDLLSESFDRDVQS